MTTTRNWIILSLALASLGIFFTLSSLFTTTQNSNRSIHVLSLNQDLKSGQIIKKSMLVWLPRASYTNNNLVAKNIDERIKLEKQAIGTLLSVDLKKSSSISKSTIIKSGESGFLSRVVRSGYRAISIKVQQSSLSDGLISPGDYVDVIATIKATQNRSSSSSVRLNSQDFRTWRSNIIATGVKILALNHHFSGDAFIKEQKAQKKRAKFITVTFEVTPEQAVKIPLAEQIVDRGGRLTFSLRNPNDEYLQSAQSRASDLFPETREEAIKENTLLIRGSRREVSGGL